jgi:hypothetical protein
MKKYCGYCGCRSTSVEDFANRVIAALGKGRIKVAYGRRSEADKDSSYAVTKAIEKVTRSYFKAKKRDTQFFQKFMDNHNKPNVLERMLNTTIGELMAHDNHELTKVQKDYKIPEKTFKNQLMLKVQDAFRAGFDDGHTRDVKGW